MTDMMIDMTDLALRRLDEGNTPTAIVRYAIGFYRRSLEVINSGALPDSEVARYADEGRRWAAGAWKQYGGRVPNGLIQISIKLAWRLSRVVPLGEARSRIVSYVAYRGGRVPRIMGPGWRQWRVKVGSGSGVVEEMDW